MILGSHYWTLLVILGAYGYFGLARMFHLGLNLPSEQCSFDSCSTSLSLNKPPNYTTEQ